MGVLGGTLSECYFLWGACSGHGSFHSPYPAIHKASLCRLDLDEGYLGFFVRLRDLGSLRGLGVCLVTWHAMSVRWSHGFGVGSTSPTLVWGVVLVVPK